MQLDSRKDAHQPRTKRIFSPLVRIFQKLTRGPTRPSGPEPEPIAFGNRGRAIDMGGPSHSYSTNRAFSAMFQGARQFSMSGSPQFFNIGVQNVNDNENYSLRNMKTFVSFNALHDSSVRDPERRCHPGTRENVLKQMRQWVDNPNVKERILWLHGPAGVGKSAIAQTISHSYGRDKVAATFFFFRLDSSRNNGNRLFTTLAWQLAISIREFRYHLTRSLNENPDAPQKAIEIQFEQLIAQPLRAMAGDMTRATSQPVIVIDGVDECFCETLQKRFLAIIGNAVAGSDFPLRFLISSRPEAHIQDYFFKSRCPTLQIDLADLDEAYNDIELYLRAEFTRIAVEQQLDPESWPEDTVIEELISKSSGQFVYASTVVKFVGDEYSSAIPQLDIIMELRPSDKHTPFAELDALYIDILQRQPKQKFMKDFLAILIARNTFNDDDLYKDDSLLLNVDEAELCRKLRGMHSLLKFLPHITAYHRSFLDFLVNPSRSRQYCIGQQDAMRRYLEFIVDAVVRFANKSLVNHRTEHFTPEFSFSAAHSYLFSLPLEVLEEVLHPLLSLHDAFVHSYEFVAGWKWGLCDECRVFDIIESLLLYLTLVRRSSLPSGSKSVVERKATANKGITRPMTSPHSSRLLSPNFTQPNISPSSASVPGKESDKAFFLLIAELRNIEAKPLLNKPSIDLLEGILLSDYSSIVTMLPSLSDAQNLVDFIFYLANDKGLLKHCRPSTVRNLTLFALEIYATIPLIPLPLVVHKEEVSPSRFIYTFPIKPFCQHAFICSLLSHDNIAAVRNISVTHRGFAIVLSCEEKCSLSEWRRESHPSTAEVLQRLIDVAKAVQYLHSMGLMFDISRNQIFLDSSSCTKIWLSFIWHDENPPCHIVVYDLGRIFYEIYFDIDLSYFDQDSAFLHQPNEPKIHDECWSLIKRCRADDPKMRPTVDDVVAEMESRRAVWIS